MRVGYSVHLRRSRQATVDGCSCDSSLGFDAARTCPSVRPARRPTQVATRTSHLLSEDAIRLLLCPDDLDEDAKHHRLFQIAEQAGLVGDPAFRDDWVPLGG